MNTLPPGSLITVLLRNFDGTPVEVQGRATGVPGLVANHPIGGGEDWGISHERSGLSLAFWTADPELAIRFAYEVASLCDWTMSGENIDVSLGRPVLEIGRRLGLEYHADQAPSEMRRDLVSEL